MTKLLSVSLVAFLMLATAYNSQARIKCWTNNEGIRECGDRVPPEFSQKEQEEVTEQGVVVGTKDRAKTDEELAEEKRLEDIRLEEERLAKEAAMHDRMLTDTYNNVDELEMARDGKISAMQSQINYTEDRVEKLQENLDRQIAAAAEAERAGKQPTEEMLRNIESVRQQITDSQAFTLSRNQEIEELRGQYSRDIIRYKQLKGMRE